MIVTRFRGTVLLFAFVATQVLSLLVISLIWPEWASAKPSLRFPEAVAGLLSYSLLFGWLIWMFARRGDSIRDLFGPLPAPRDLKWRKRPRTAELQQVLAPENVVARL